MDSRATPLGELVPGVAIQAQLIEQIIAQDFIERPDWTNGLEIVLTVLFGALVAGLVLAFGARFSFYAGVVVFVAGLAGSWIAFSHFRLLIDPIFPSLAALAVYIAVERVLHVASDHEKKFVRQAFGQYLAPELLAQLENSPQAMRLGGESRDISVMFMDVRGFTPISEALTATELVDFINMLLAPLSDAIQDELGTIDKYIGDSIMAFWNAPVNVPDHATRACRAALKMREAVNALNDSDAFGFSARGFEDPRVRIGVGINAGLACVGNMGSRAALQLFGDGRRRERRGPDRVGQQGIACGPFGFGRRGAAGEGDCTPRSRRNPVERQVAANQDLRHRGRRGGGGIAGVRRVEPPARRAAGRYQSRSCARGHRRAGIVPRTRRRGHAGFLPAFCRPDRGARHGGAATAGTGRQIGPSVRAGGISPVFGWLPFFSQSGMLNEMPTEWRQSSRCERSRGSRPHSGTQAFLRSPIVPMRITVLAILLPILAAGGGAGPRRSANHARSRRLRHRIQGEIRAHPRPPTSA